MNALNLEFVLLIFNLHLFGCPLSDTDSMLSMEGCGWQWQAGRGGQGSKLQRTRCHQRAGGMFRLSGANANCFGLVCAVSSRLPKAHSYSSVILVLFGLRNTILTAN